jgi:hypothetical protein
VGGAGGAAARTARQHFNAAAEAAAAGAPGAGELLYDVEYDDGDAEELIPRRLIRRTFAPDPALVRWIAAACKFNRSHVPLGMGSGEIRDHQVGVLLPKVCCYRRDSATANILLPKMFYIPIPEETPYHSSFYYCNPHVDHTNSFYYFYNPP